MLRWSRAWLTRAQSMIWSEIMAISSLMNAIIYPQPVLSRWFGKQKPGSLPVYLQPSPGRMVTTRSFLCNVDQSDTGWMIANKPRYARLPTGLLSVKPILFCQVERTMLQNQAFRKCTLCSQRISIEIKWLLTMLLKPCIMAVRPYCWQNGENTSPILQIPWLVK